MQKSWHVCVYVFLYQWPCRDYHSSSDHRVRSSSSPRICKKVDLKNLSKVHQYFESSSSQQIEGVWAQKGMFHSRHNSIGFRKADRRSELQGEIAVETVPQNILQAN